MNSLTPTTLFDMRPAQVLYEIKDLQKQWRDQNWVRIGSDGSIKGACGTSKNKKNPDRCLPASKANSLSKGERASTARRKKREGAKGKTVVANTPKAKVKSKRGRNTKAKRADSLPLAVPTSSARRVLTSRLRSRNPSPRVRS